MKYCSKCGSEIADEAVVCPKCGCAVDNVKTSSSGNGIKTATKVFLVLSCVSSCIMTLIYFICAMVAIADGSGGLFFTYLLLSLPSFWVVPMTISYFSKVKNGEILGTGFKVCTLIFVNIVAGILMLCDNGAERY